MSGPFRDSGMRAQYEIALECYAAKHPDLFRPDGSRCKGSSFALFFWDGFDGKTKGIANFSDPASRRMVGYAYYRAGKACARPATTRDGMIAAIERVATENGHQLYPWIKNRWGFHAHCAKCGAFVGITVSRKAQREGERLTIPCEGRQK